GMDGLTATREVIAAHPDARVVVLTTFDVDEYVYEALRVGASGFLLKSADGDTLVEAVRVVAGGEALLAPEVTRRVIEEFARASRAAASPPLPGADGRVADGPAVSDDAAVADDADTSGAAGHQPSLEAIGDLSDREVEVLQLMAQGLSNAEIASELFLSPT